MSIQRVEIRQTLGPISTVEVRQGPKGDHGDAGAVTNASVNAAIATDAAATRTSLGLGSAALLTGSATFSAGGAMVWGTSKTQTLSDIWAAPKYPRAIAFSGTLETDRGTLTTHPVLRPWTALSTGYAEYSEDGTTPGPSEWTLRYSSGTWKLTKGFGVPGGAIWTSEATTDPDPTKVTTWTPSGRAISGTPVLYSADVITNTTLGLAFTSDKAQIASASFVAGKAILWGTTAAATMANLGAGTTGAELFGAETPSAAIQSLVVSGVLTLSNGATWQEQWWYSTTDGGSNYEYLKIAKSGASWAIANVKSGTGPSRNIQLIAKSALYLGANGGDGWNISTSKHLSPDGTTKTRDIGSETSRARTLYAQDINLALTASATPANNGDMTIEATSNTSITIKLKGSDGTVRSVVLTLA